MHSVRSEGERVAVVGGGIIGLSIAAYLLKSGISVTVYEPADPEQQTSAGNAGALSQGSVAPFGMPGILKKVPGMLLDANGPLYLRPSYALAAAPWLARFVLACRTDRTEKISRALSVLHGRVFKAYESLLAFCEAEDLLRRTGQLHLYRDRKGLAADDASWRLRRDRGVDWQTVEGDDLRRLEPAVSDKYRIGVFMPNEGMILSPLSLLLRLRDAVLRAGACIRPFRVTRVNVDNEGQIELQDEQEGIVYQKVIIAAGAWSAELCRQVGFKVPLETQRGYHVMYSGSTIALKRPITAADSKIFASPIDGGIRIAGTVEFAGLDRPKNHKRCLSLVRHGRALIPELPEQPTGTWMGNRPCLPDSLPVIGQSPCHANLYFAFGHGHLGLTGAAATAEIICSLIKGKNVEIDLSPYAVDRF